MWELKLLKENIEIHLDLGLGNHFLDMTPKAQATKQKINRMYFIKIKNFCAPKGTLKKIKDKTAQLPWAERGQGLHLQGGAISRVGCVEWFASRVFTY